MELLQLLTSQLGVTDDQAKGGSGLLFKMAKDSLGSADFAKVAGAVPGIEGLISSAPESAPPAASGGLMGALGALAPALGGGAGQLGALAGLAGGFKTLGLDSGMVGKFVPILLSFVQSKGGAAASGLLTKALK